MDQIDLWLLIIGGFIGAFAALVAIHNPGWRRTPRHLTPEEHAGGLAWQRAQWRSNRLRALQDVEFSEYYPWPFRPWERWKAARRLARCDRELAKLEALASGIPAPPPVSLAACFPPTSPEARELLDVYGYVVFPVVDGWRWKWSPIGLGCVEPDVDYRTEDDAWRGAYRDLLDRLERKGMASGGEATGPAPQVL